MANAVLESARSTVGDKSITLKTLSSGRWVAIGAIAFQPALPPDFAGKRRENQCAGRLKLHRAQHARVRRPLSA